jgi:lipopolysaccharide export system protein LptC
MSRMTAPTGVAAGVQPNGDRGTPRPVGQALGKTGAYLQNAGSGRDRLPPPDSIARRQFAIGMAKWVLPGIAVVLLAAVAVWPELKHLTSAARTGLSRIAGEVEGGKLIEPRYNGVDEHGRPYTVTAATAWQIDGNRIGLTMPKGDITLENGTWLMISAKNGTFMQHLNQLDLVNDVTLYRDDGTTMRTHSAAIDMKAGAAAGSEDVHVEGPFGTLDAKGFAVMDKGAAIDFPGPAHVVLNGSEK